jgi:hypothetical protein
MGQGVAHEVDAAALPGGAVNGARNLPISGEVKFPSLAGMAISR